MKSYKRLECLECSGTGEINVVEGSYDYYKKCPFCNEEEDFMIVIKPEDWFYKKENYRIEVTELEEDVLLLQNVDENGIFDCQIMLKIKDIEKILREYKKYKNIKKENNFLLNIK